MKKVFFIWLGIALSCTTFLRAWNPPDFTLGTTGDTKTVTLSTTPTSPTQILTRDSYVQRTYIINNSSFTIFFSTVSTILSTSTTNGSFSVKGNSTATGGATIFSPDGVNSPYQGPMWAASETTASPPSISIFRSK